MLKSTERLSTKERPRVGALLSLAREIEQIYRLDWGKVVMVCEGEILGESTWRDNWNGGEFREDMRKPS